MSGRVAISSNNLVRVYEFGRKKLLKKCELRHIPNLVVDMKSMGPRLYISDVEDSVYFAKYKVADNSLNIYADDLLNRWVTATCLLDYSTLAIGDKFGNVAIIRMSDKTNDDLQENRSTLWQEKGYLNGASQKAQLLAVFHVGEIITSLERSVLIPGGSECLVYSTLSGRIAALLPFTSREDREFMQHLELHLRSEKQPLTGRDHLAYRSAYIPVKNIVDGDLCEQYSTLELSKQKEIAEELDRTCSEVLKKLEDVRNRYAF